MKIVPILIMLMMLIPWGIASPQDITPDEIIDGIDEIVKKEFSYGINEDDFPADDLIEGSEDDDEEEYSDED